MEEKDRLEVTLKRQESALDVLRGTKDQQERKKEVRKIAQQSQQQQREQITENPTFIPTNIEETPSSIQRENFANLKLQVEDVSRTIQGLEYERSHKQRECRAEDMAVDNIQLEKNIQQYPLEKYCNSKGIDYNEALSEYNSENPEIRHKQRLQRLLYEVELCTKLLDTVQNLESEKRLQGEKQFAVRRQLEAISIKLNEGIAGLEMAVKDEATTIIEQQQENNINISSIENNIEYDTDINIENTSI